MHVRLVQHPSHCCLGTGKLSIPHSLCMQAGEYAYMSDPVNWHSEAGKTSKEKGGQPFKPAQLNSKGPFAKTPVRYRLDKGMGIYESYRERLLVVRISTDEYSYSSASQPAALELVLHRAATCYFKPFRGLHELTSLMLLAKQSSYVFGPFGRPACKGMSPCRTVRSRSWESFQAIA